MKITGTFPPIGLPIAPPFPPMEASSAEVLPRGRGWMYEPKWDGFRCLASRRDRLVLFKSSRREAFARWPRRGSRR